MTAPRILIIAGGAGGHIFPALAVAEELQKNHIEIHWLGSVIGLEQKLVEPYYPFHSISVRRLRGKSFWTRCLFPFHLFSSTLQALKIIRKLKPDLVLGMGGFASGPGGLAARILGHPLVIHEQNSVAGFTNRILAKITSLVFSGFPQAFANSVTSTAIGNPVRSTIVALPPPRQRLQNSNREHLRILILGGSQGAHWINEFILKFMQEFPEKNRIQLWHQTGDADFEWVTQRYQQLQVPARVEKFIDNMADAYAWGDLAVCRAGALTVSEITAAGLASLLIPFPFAADNHQYHNGCFLEKNGAALVLQQKELTISKMTSLIHSFIQDRENLVQMAEKARALAKPNATLDLVSACLFHLNQARSIKNESNE